MRFGRGLVAAACAAAALAHEGPARAVDPAQAQLAEALFSEARTLMASKRYTEACPKLAESQRLDPSMGTLLNLAVCHEEDGKLATAAAEYREVIAIATRENRADRRVLAEARLKALEASVPKLAVSPSARVQELEGVAVTLDGLELRAPAWGVASPVDPGAHLVTVSAANHASWTTTVPIQRGETRNVEIDLPEPLAAPPGTWPAAAPPPRALPPPMPEAGGATKHNPVHTVLLVSSLAGYAGAVAFGLMTLAANKRASDGCLADRGYCFTEDGRDAAASRNTYAWLSTISIAVAVGSSIGLLVVPVRVSTTAKAPPATRLGIGLGAVSLAGTF